MAEHRTTGIYPLHEVGDLKVADGEVDPRGWDVYSLDGERLGAVRDLLVDVAARKVRYLEVELAREAVADRGERRVLFPVGTARLDDRDDRVFVDAQAGTVAGYPAYQGTAGPVSRDYEDALLRTVSPAGTTAGTAAAPGEITAAELDYYSNAHFDTDRFYGARGRRASDTGLTGADARADYTGPLDRLDDLKDRLDGNPASRPGPDATDR